MNAPAATTIQTITRHSLAAAATLGLLAGITACADDSAEAPHTPPAYTNARDPFTSGGSTSRDTAAQETREADPVDDGTLPEITWDLINDPDNRAKITRPAPYPTGGFSDAQTRYRVLAPGTHINTAGQFCTLGAIARSGGATIGITAGHCFPTPGEVLWNSASEGVSSAGRSAYTAVDDADTARGSASDRQDYAIMNLDPASDMRGSVEGTTPFAGVLPPAELTSDTIVCSSGAASGGGCGYMLGSSGVRGLAAVPAAPGDSGGPVYTTRYGSTYLVGFLNATYGSGATALFTYAAPIFEQHGLTLIGS